MAMAVPGAAEGGAGGVSGAAGAAASAAQLAINTAAVVASGTTRSRTRPFASSART